MSRTTITGALLLASAIAAATPLSVSAQAPSGSGMTVPQYVILQERVNAFCRYYEQLEKEGKPLPAGTLTFPGAGGVKWVFRESEVQPTVKRCRGLMPLMQGVAG